MTAVNYNSRAEHIPASWRRLATVKGNDVFGGKSFKMKRCGCCKKQLTWDTFYLKAGRQNMHPDVVAKKDLRSWCIVCFDADTATRRPRKSKLNLDQDNVVETTSSSNTLISFITENKDA
jgi:hypothetical protein